MKTDPIQHARAAMQMALDAFGEDAFPQNIYVTLNGGAEQKIRLKRANRIKIKFRRGLKSITWGPRSVHFTDTIRYSLSQPDMSDIKHEPARGTIVHEAWHVVQAQGRSMISWWWYYVWNRARLEREAEAMAVKYRDTVR